MTLLLVIVLIASVIFFIFFEQLSIQAKELLNNDNYIDELVEGKLTLKVRRRSVRGWIARLLEKVKYLEAREETTYLAEYFYPEYVEGQDVRIQFLAFNITHAGLNARESNWFGLKLFGRIVFYLLTKLLWILLTIGGLLWLYEKGLNFKP